MSDDLATQLRESLRVDPGLPPGVVIQRTGIDQAIGVINAHGLEVQARTAISPVLAEDCRSLLESEPFVVRYGEAGEPIRCECCGTLVTAMPEREREGEWKRGIWETDVVRKHTLRRCDWLRVNV